MSPDRVDLATQAAELTLSALQEADRSLGSRFCRVCGCTDRYGCDGGCAWADEDLCSCCADVEPGPELPEYPELPVVDGRLVLDELEAWQLERKRRSAEVDVAYLDIVEGRAPQTDMAAVAAAMSVFETRGRRDLHWVCGYLAGRSAPVCSSEGQIRRSLVSPGYAEGVSAGMAAAATSFEALGQTTTAAALRDVVYPREPAS